ncbi:MAG: SWIM zinc finger family protein [Acidimicrobiales bacterium]
MRRLTVDDNIVRATVDGSRPYRVALKVTGAGISGECTCPYGMDGMFCKHCVATAVIWLEAGPSTVVRPGADRAQRQVGITDAALRIFLGRQDPEWLAEQLMRAADADPLLHAQLEVAAGADAREAYDDTDMRARLTRAIASETIIDYGGATSYFGEIDDTLSEVEELVFQGFPDAAIELTEYALELLEESAGMVDDTDGGLRVVIERVEGIHLRACEAGLPDPVALAERLASIGLTSDWEVFLTALPGYADVLGTTGMDRYREIVEAAWRALPARPAGGYDHERFTPTFLMERLAECQGGADALIEVMSRDIASAYDVLRVAERLTADGRDAEALNWLDRGMTEFEPDPRLRSLAAECMLRADRRSDALELLWVNFTGRPSLETYEPLCVAAGDSLPTWRERALALLREQPRSAERWSGHPYVELPGHSTLVEVTLWEGDVDSAWDAAQNGGCRSRLWLQLARERAKNHPADAIPILEEAAQHAVGAKQRRAYQEAARLLGEARTLAGRCGQDEAFRTFVVRLRAEHKPKRALQEELDRAGLPR